MNNTIKRISNPEALVLIGKRLRAEREGRQLSQIALGKKANGVRQATISRLEQGGDATLDTLLSLASAMGLEIALVPIGQGTVQALGAPGIDLLAEFADLNDDDEGAP